MCSIMSTTMIRVRLYFDNIRSSSCLHARKLWMVVNFNTCKHVADLESAIIARFFRNQGVKLTLSVDDFLLPQDEVIQIIRDDDMVRVEVSYDGDHLNNGISLSSGDDEQLSRKSKKRRKKEKVPEPEPKSTSIEGEPVYNASSNSVSKVKHNKLKKHNRQEVMEEDSLETEQSPKKKKKKKKKHKEQELEEGSSSREERGDKVGGVSKTKSKSKKTVVQSDTTASRDKDLSNAKTKHVKKTVKNNKEVFPHLDQLTPSFSASSVSVSQKQDETFKKKSKRTEIISKVDRPNTISEQSFTDSKTKRKNVDSKVHYKQNVMLPKPFTKKDIDKVIETKQKDKMADKPIGQRLLEISQNSKGSFKPISSKPKGHIRFSSSSESSSSSSSDSESSSSEDEAKKSTLTYSKEGSGTSVVADGLHKSPANSKDSCRTSGESTNVANILPKSPAILAAEDQMVKIKSPAAASKDLVVKTSSTIMTDNMKEEGDGDNKDKYSDSGAYLQNTSSAKHSTPGSIETNKDAPNDDAMTEEESGDKGIGIHGARSRRRQQRGWNPMSKKGQLNTQLTNKSIMMQNSETLSPNGDMHDGHINGITAPSNVAETPAEPKDYAPYPVLIGPPRAGDKIAYKTLELSNNYCPEVSDYKEAEVVRYSPESKNIDVKLTSGQFQPQKRHGKFELHFGDNEGKGEQEEVAKQPNNLVTIELSSLIEPKLLQ